MVSDEYFIQFLIDFCVVQYVFTTTFDIYFLFGVLILTLIRIIKMYFNLILEERRFGQRRETF